MYVRYATHLGAYLAIAANPYPSFTGTPGYAVDVSIPERQSQPRWQTAFRLLLAIPALMLAATLGSFAGGGGGSQAAEDGGSKAEWFASSGFGGVAAVCAVLGWFAAVALGRMPLGLRNLAAFGLGYTAQAYAYVLLLTDRYPNSDPEAIGREWELPPHTVRLELDDDGRRSRLTAFFRLLLAIPHFVWLALWTIAAFFAAIANFFVALVRGRSADALHRFLAAYVRYYAHVVAFVTLVANPFPGFDGSPGVPGRHRARPARASEPLGDAVPPHPRDPGLDCLGRAQRGALRDCVPRLVRGARDRTDAHRAPQARRLRDPLRLTDERVLAHRHRPTIRTQARRCARRPSPSRRTSTCPSRSSRRRSDEPARGDASSRAARARGLVGGSGLVALAERGPGRPRPGPRLAGRDPARHSRAGRPLRALLPGRVRRLGGRPPRRARALRQVRHPLRQGVGCGPDRHGDAARDDRAGPRLDLAGPFPPRRGLVGPPLRPDRQRLHRDALRELVRARSRVSVHLLRARRGDGARGTVPAPLVARRRTVLRRARLPLPIHLSVPDADGAAAASRPGGRGPRVRGEAGDRPGAAPRRGRHRLHERAERLRRRLRPEQADRLLEHAPRRQLHGRAR